MSATPFKLISNTKRNMIKKTNVSKLKEQQYVHVLQPKAEHQGNKFPFTDFRWIGPCTVEKAFPYYNYLVRKIAAKKTRVLYCMKLRLFTPRQHTHDIQVTSQECTPDPKDILKHDDLYARVWKTEYETPIFDNGHKEPDNDISPGITVRDDRANDETCTFTGTIQEYSPEIFPHTDEVGDRSDTDH